ncbi:MAG: FAD-binding protein [Chloroflexota bacterium]|jgi:succinate dehydrogenase/fumarate reductase flavoprotein subunit
MGYPDYMKASIAKVEASRERRLNETVPLMSLAEREDVLKRFYPANQPGALEQLRVGPNKGEYYLKEFVNILESRSPVDPSQIDLSKPDYDVDVLIIGGGAAGMSASLMCTEEGVTPLLVTKLRLGDANSMMSQGGIQAAISPVDSPDTHYLDCFGGGQFANVPELVRALVTDAPQVIKWLEGLGVMFDKDPDGKIKVKHGGGTSKKRLISTRDISGAGITRVLRDEVWNRNIPVLEFTSALEILLDEEGKAAGAVLFNMETEQYYVARAKVVVLNTGGSGRLHFQGFPTTNHYGATGDGLVMAYRAGAKLVFMDTVQYHPTGGAFPEQTVGLLVAETARAMFGQLVDSEGEQFVNNLEPRDVTSSAIIRQCKERGRGITTPSGISGVWLDTPMVDLKNGPGTLFSVMPVQCKRYWRFGYDPTKEPILITPVHHYQNGGILINDQAETNVPNLFAGGEVEGGVHGRNRLMGNSWADIMVFGRRSGISAARRAKETPKPKTLSLKHVDAYHKEMQENGVSMKRIAPILLPNYTRPEIKDRIPPLAAALLENYTPFETEMEGVLK